MSNKEYPLHPGQTQASPDYIQVPQSEYESLKRENKQLHALLHEANRQDGNAEIDTLASECRALREMNAKAQEEIATLKEAQRWRKVSEQLPKKGGEVFVTNGIDRGISEWCGNHWNDDPFCGYTVCDIIAWMPMPKAPEAE
jgi:hypothetical protein